MGVAFAGLSRRPKVAQREKGFAGTLTSALCFWPGGGLVCLYLHRKEVFAGRDASSSSSVDDTGYYYYVLEGQTLREHQAQTRGFTPAERSARCSGGTISTAQDASEGAPTQGSSAQADCHIGQEEAQRSERSVTTATGQDSPLETAFRASTEYSAHPSCVARSSAVALGRFGHL